jgi:spore coat protein U-like protein
MTRTLARACALLLLLLTGCLWMRPAHADISCTANMSALTFTVDPLTGQASTNTATFTYTCSNGNTSTRSAMVCASIGEPNGGQTNPRLMSDASGDTLRFDMFQDGGYSQIWGSQFFGTNTPLMFKVTLGRNSSTTKSITLYGRVEGNQFGTPPGTYQDNYQNYDTALTINQQSGNTAPTNCGGSVSPDYFPFTVSATVAKNCLVSASPLDFGTTTGVLSANVDVNTSLTAQCTSGTPYTVSLDNGQNAVGTTRRMKGSSSGQYISYELYANAGRTSRWGANSSSGTGSGNAQPLTVYGRVPPQTTPKADTYTDLITVTVSY